MKKIAALILSLAMVLSLAACGGSKSAAPADDSAAAAPEGDSGPIALTLWGAEEDQTLLAELVEQFKAAYPDQTFDIKIGVESESTAKDTILTDVEAAADVFAFADDQLPDLVNAGALLSVDSVDEALQAVAGTSVAQIKELNDAGSITAATSDDTLYAFPMSGGNGFFLYYDRSVVSDEDAQSWDTLLAAAEKDGKKVGMTLASGWYNASFFLGAGFTTALNADGTTTIDWNGTSSSGITGVQVVQAMEDIAGNSAFMAIADGDTSNQIASGKLAAVISGTWDADAVKTAFGDDNYAASKLPTFTCGGKQVQQGSYVGYKLMGVNAYSKNAGWAAVLAEFLTNEASQTARYEARQSLPTNVKAASAESIQSNPALTAVIAQGEFGTVQTVGGKYWDPTATFGEKIAQGQIGSDEAAIQGALDELVSGVSAPVD